MVIGVKADTDKKADNLAKKIYGPRFGRRGARMEAMQNRQGMYDISPEQIENLKLELAFHRLSPERQNACLRLDALFMRAALVGLTPAEIEEQKSLNAILHQTGV